MRIFDTTGFMFSEHSGKDKRGIYGVTIYLRAPSAHPVWSDYVMLGYDLHDRVGLEPARKLRPGVTHEFMLFALNPATPINFEKPAIEQTHVQRLRPANLGYQVIVGTDDEADMVFRRRLLECVKKIEHGELSPDTDFRRMWDAIFEDGQTLMKSAFGD